MALLGELKEIEIIMGVPIYGIFDMLESDSLQPVLKYLSQYGGKDGVLYGVKKSIHFSVYWANCLPESQRQWADTLLPLHD